MFKFLKKKIVYFDRLHEWRNVKIHDYHLLDKVWVIRTIEQSKRSHPHCTYQKNIEYSPEEGIIIGSKIETFYSDIKVGGQIDYEGWEYMDDNGNIQEFKGKIVYKYKKGYRVLLRDGSYIDAHTVKKSHGEFQEEFEHMTELEKKKKEVLEAQQRYENSLHEMDDLLSKGREIQTKLLNRIIK